MAAADPQMRIETLEAALRAASRELHWANLTIQKKDVEIRLLEERLRKQRIGFLGPASETLSDLLSTVLTAMEISGRDPRGAEGSGGWMRPHFAMPSTRVVLKGRWNRLPGAMA